MPGPAGTRQSSSAGIRPSLRPAGPRRPRRPSGRRRLAAAGMVAALGMLVWLAVSRIDFSQVGRAVARLDGWWLALAVAFMAGAFLCRAESWFAAIREALPDEQIGRAAVTRALLIGMAASAVAPGRLGEAARTWLIARRASRIREALPTVLGTLLSQALLNLLALWLLAVVALAGSAIRGARTGSIVLTAAVPAAGVAALLAAPALVARGRGWEIRWLRRVSEWSHLQLVRLRRGLVVFRRPGPAVRSGGFQLGAWALQLGCCYAVLLAFGLQDRAGLPAAAAVLVAVNITAVVPVTPSNVGVFQAACVGVLAPFHVSAGQGLAYGLVLQAVEIACALGMGIPSLLREGVSVSELHAGAGAGVSEPSGRGY